jgi:hypothetical protein
MEIKQQTGCMGPNSLDHLYGDETEKSTPDPETLRIMLDPNSYVLSGGQSSWALLPPEERQAREANLEAQQLASQEEIGKLYEERAKTEAIEPISGVPYSKTRIYGRHEGGEWIFFGVREPGMRMREFWAKYDPDDTRGDCGGSDLSLSASPEPVASNPRVGARSKQSQPRSKATAKDRVKKSTTPPPTANTGTRRSLAYKGNVDSMNVQQLPPSPHMEAFGRPILAPTLKAAQEMNGKGGPARRKTSPQTKAASTSTKKVKKDTSLALQPGTRTSTTKNERKVVDIPAPQRRTPAPKKPTRQAEKKQKPTIARGNARVTKQKKVKERAPAPSAHKMRTRAQGPAENLQLS